MSANFRFTILALLVAIAWMSCAGRHYTLAQFHRNGSEVMVTGQAFDASTGTPLPGTWIRNDLDSSRIYTNKDGWYKMKLSASRQRIKAVYLGYYLNSTKKFKPRPGDSLVLNFRMKVDSRPLLD